jgi:hypothetical protein
VIGEHLGDMSELIALNEKMVKMSHKTLGEAKAFIAAAAVKSAPAPPQVSDVEARAELCTSSGFEPVHVTAAYHDLFSLAALRAPVPSAESALEHASMQFVTASTDAQPSLIDSVSLLGATVNPAFEGDASAVGSSATAGEQDDAQCATETTLSTATRSLILAVPPADDMAAPTLCSKAETATSTTTRTVGLLASPQVLVAQQPQQQHPREKKKSGCSLFRCFRRHRDSED